jgi:hypothetical protein
VSGGPQLVDHVPDGVGHAVHLREERLSHDRYAHTATVAAVGEREAIPRCRVDAGGLSTRRRS